MKRSGRRRRTRSSAHRPGRGARLVAVVGLLAGCQSDAPPSPVVEVATPRAVPPNMLWIVAEDQSPDLGSYGDDDAIMPHLDRLASEGARFTRAFATAPVCAPARSTLITGMYATTIGSHSMRSAVAPPAYVKAFPEWLRAAGYYTSTNATTDYTFSPGRASDRARPGREALLGAWDDSRREAGWRHRDPDRPFFAMINLGVTREEQAGLPDDQFAEWTRPLTADQRHDPAAASLPPYYPDTPEGRGNRARAYDLVTALDAEVGEILAELEADGLADDTIVFFSGDHGRGRSPAPRGMYDSGLQVPLIVRWPGRIDAGSTRDDLVSVLDFAPTILSLAGVKVPDHLPGRVFLGEGTGPPPDRLFFTHDRRAGGSGRRRAVRDERYKYIRNVEPGLPDAPSDELYDTAADPHEMVNLAGDPAHADRLAIMRQALEAWTVETGDLGARPEADLGLPVRPGGLPPVTAPPEVNPKGGNHHAPPTVTITCPTEGATAVFTTDRGPDPRWHLYVGPFWMADWRLRARCGRLGYVDSDIVSYHFDVEFGWMVPEGPPSCEMPGGFICTDRP